MSIKENWHWWVAAAIVSTGLMVVLRDYASPDLSLFVVGAPLGVVGIAVFSLGVGAAWDRALRGRNVTLQQTYRVKPKASRFGSGLGLLIGLTIGMAAVMASTGCTTYRAVYATGATTTQYVRGEQEEYTSALRKRAAQCDPRLNPTSAVTTFSEFETCLGEGFHLSDVQLVAMRLAEYNESAEDLTEALLTSQDRWRWRAALVELLGSASKYLRALPAGSSKIDGLRRLLGPTGRGVLR